MACSAGCQASPTPLGAWRPTEAQLALVGAERGVTGWHRDVVVRCPEAESFAEIESPDLRQPCEVLILEGERLVPTAIPDAYAAERLAGDAVLVVERHGTLVARRRDGTLIRALDVAVSEAHASEDGLRAAYVRDVPGTSATTGDLSTEIVIVSVSTGAIVRVVADPNASHPRLLPGGADDVLYVSRRSGQEALWRASPSGTPVQLTNTDGGPGPWGRRYELLDRVPGSDATWLSDASDPTLLAWGELYGEPHAYLFHADGRPPYRLGRGLFPRQLDDGSLAAVERSPEGSVRVHRLDGAHR